MSEEEGVNELLVVCKDSVSNVVAVEDGAGLGATFRSPEHLHALMER